MGSETKVVNWRCCDGYFAGGTPTLPGKALEGAIGSGKILRVQYFQTALVFLFISAGAIRAGERTLRFFAQPGGQVSIQGGHKPYDWEVQGRVIQGTFECGPGFPVKDGQVVKSGKMDATLEGAIPLRSLHSCYGSMIDEFMYSQLDEPNAPRILFHFSNLVLTNSPISKRAPYRFNTHAELVLAGVTNRIAMPISVMPLSGDKLKITGNTFITLANLGLQASRAASVFIKNGDQVKLSFEWLVGRKPLVSKPWKQRVMANDE